MTRGNPRKFGQNWVPGRCPPQVQGWTRERCPNAKASCGTSFKTLLISLPEYEQAVLIAAIEHVLARRGIDICAGDWGKPLGEGLYEFRIKKWLKAVLGSAGIDHDEPGADRTKEGWSDDARRVYEAVSTELQAEVDGQSAIGRQLAAARKARAMSQPALSAITGIQQAEISRIERGLGNPTAVTLSRLAGALDLRFSLVPSQR